VLGVLAACAAVVLALLTLTWAVSLPLRDASIVDIIWGLAFVAIAWAAFLAAPDDAVAARQWLLAVLVTVWGVRLAGYLAWRNLGKGEDRRYTAMRTKRANFALWSLGGVFLLQAALAWVVSLPVQLGMAADGPDRLSPLTWVGVALWAVGFGFETVGDLQLARFKADPANGGAVMDRGLWRYTRHPNYFGDFCVWWGLFLVAAETGVALLGVVGPLLMSILLTRVSGRDLLERSIGKRRPGYAEYVARTNGFFPGPPRRGPLPSPPAEPAGPAEPAAAPGTDRR
jgi:steroid 5-alpha reductase family enzyme